MRRRVSEAVAKAVQPGEAVRGTVYLHVYRSATSSVAVGGLPVNIGTWILSVTDRRALLLAGGVNAADSRLVADCPRASVTVDPEGRPDRPSHLRVTFGAQGSHRFAVPNIWRRDAAALVVELAG